MQFGFCTGHPDGTVNRSTIAGHVQIVHMYRERSGQGFVEWGERSYPWALRFAHTYGFVKTWSFRYSLRMQALSTIGTKKFKNPVLIDRNTRVSRALSTKDTITQAPPYTFKSKMGLLRW